MCLCVYQQGMPDNTCDFAKNAYYAKIECPYESNGLCEDNSELDQQDMFD